MQNEDDASVALHVSNALTQALLQFRMTNIQEEVNNLEYRPFFVVKTFSFKGAFKLFADTETFSESQMGIEKNVLLNNRP